MSSVPPPNLPPVPRVAAELLNSIDEQVKAAPGAYQDGYWLGGTFDDQERGRAYALTFLTADLLPATSSHGLLAAVTQGLADALGVDAVSLYDGERYVERLNVGHFFTVTLPSGGIVEYTQFQLRKSATL